MRTEDERRGRTNELIRPRYMVWENVPGAFSSNKGKDFAAVIEEAIRIVEPQAPCIEVPERGWPTWGGYRDVGGRWSLAWRVLDAQYWGVPQRRRRIALVVDFGGDTAHEILFERKSLFGNPAPGGTAGERTATRAEKSPSYAVGNGQANEAANHSLERAKPLDAMHDAQAVFCPDVSHALKAKANCDFREDSETYVSSATMQVRRLTPLECTRLQGFPDGWVDIGEWVDDAGKTHKESDTPKYKALGNSIALPQWKWVLKRICANYGRDATMASLFDGIGGFTLIWTQLNGRNSVRWVSEIEPFPIAVTRRHFGDEDKGIVGDYQEYL